VTRAEITVWLMLEGLVGMLYRCYFWSIIFH